MHPTRIYLGPDAIFSQASVKRTWQMLHELVHELKLLIRGLIDAQITSGVHGMQLKRPGVFSDGSAVLQRYSINCSGR